MVEDRFDGAMPLRHIELAGFEQVQPFFKFLGDLTGGKHARP